MTKRIGFCCKISEMDPKKGLTSIPEYNSQTTTVAWLNRQSKSVAEEKLWDCIKHNIEAARKAVEYVGSKEKTLRLFRLGSDILPMFTEPKWSSFYGSLDVKNYIERHFKRVGDTARSLDVRLSFHPGQYTVMASDNPAIVEKSIEEFEYHATMARLMGYGVKFQDFVINVHISGRQGPNGIREAYKKLSPEARNCITIENEEISHGLDDCLSVSDIIPIVFDCHHHWIREGEYIDPTDSRIQKVIDSWRGNRPLMHYSVSREDYLVDHARDAFPSLDTLINNGYKKQKLRAHSDFYWNTAVNDWALSFVDKFDMDCEAKAKNLASFALHDYAKQKQIV
jgi:UV DNA damage endonuclease